MKICLSGSMSSIDRMETLSTQLKALGHQVLVPSRGTELHMAERLARADTLERKAIFVEDHLEKIRASDAVVIANFEKDGVSGYVGSSALMEAAMAYALGKQLFVLNESALDDVESDLSSLGAIQLNGDYRLITSAAG
ncbi:MAG: hypothetical protein AAFV92_10075 [Pseudomonadota bacterium]